MVFLIFPNQLFYSLKHLDKKEEIYLIEEPRYFTDFNFHKMKLVYHRASMKKYYDMLKKKKYNVKYFEFHEIDKSFYKNIDNPRCIKISDFKLEKKIGKINQLDNINFLVKLTELDDIKKIIYKNKKYSHDSFYKYQRIKLDILIKNDKPIGNKWSFDTENRLPLPKNHIVKEQVSKSKSNKYVIEAIKYVNKYFPDNYGNINLIYPIDNKGAKSWLMKFLKERLKLFGKYEDAVHEDEPFLYHSVISPMMNIGILTDSEVIHISYKYYLEHKSTIPIESFEAFIRQVIGWRNYVYTLYLLEGEKMMESNQLKHYNKLPFDKFWKGETGIYPIDNIIKKIVETSYAHHIERLMFLGNFMLLCNFDPKDVYKIFMEWSCDSYENIMVANVFGMSQYATDIMMTRPYFSSSKYILRMSNYKKGEWCDIWDALYYSFINKHANILKNNYAIANQVKNWERKNEDEQREIIYTANKFIKQLIK